MSLLVTANIFGPLIDVFESVLKFFHDSGGISWGWSIVFLTIAVRALLIPLTFRQIKSMVRMQGLQPQMKEIQAKYKSDKPRQQEEIMKFYKANNVNPLSSCLPMVLQLPVFISLYYMLRKSLRGDICPGTQLRFQTAYAKAHHLSSVAKASGQTVACGHSSASHFLFIHDLTAKATGVELGILVVLYIGSQLGSTLVMSGASMDPTQRKIMMFMPLIFVLFVIRFPSGLLLYWITTNLWTVAQQYTVRRYVGPTVPVVAGAGGSGGDLVLGGDGSATGSGFGGRWRDRLASAQTEAMRRKAEEADGNANGSGSGRSGGGARTATLSKPSAGKPTGVRSNGGKPNGAPKTSGTATSKANGTATRSTGSGNGNGNGGSGGTPPTSPRKKKKRSGRRR